MELRELAVNELDVRSADTLHGVFRSPIQVLLEELVETYSALGDGTIASYIPELGHADPESFGIAIASTDGAVYEAGDTTLAFTLQSISKPLTYALALESFGVAAVHERIGVEPSGDAFNAIALAPRSGMPPNAMVNAGAIATASMVAEALTFDDLLTSYSRYAGRPLTFDEAVYQSERDTGHRNRAIAHLLRAFGIVEGDPEIGLDLYFRQCAVSVDCRELALIGATLANGGVQPQTAEVAVEGGVVREVLSVMASCGMYDGAGAWMTTIGLPAKSGVSGGILAVLPGRLAIACYSPLLDQRGNSVRGVAVCRDLSERIGLHLVRPAERPAAPVRSALDLSQISSKRTRPLRDRASLDARAETAIVIELQGELGFAAIEAVSRVVEPRAATLAAVVVDVGRVSRVDDGGYALLLGLGSALTRAGIELVVSGHPATTVKSALADVIGFETLDRALEWLEDELLRREGLDAPPVRLKTDEHEFLAGLGELDRARVERMLDARTYAKHTVVVDRGGRADELFLVVKGELSVIDDSGEGLPRRAATVPAGGSFGEIGLALGGTRTATVRADTDVEVLVLSRRALDELQEHHPRLYGKILEQLLETVARTASRLDREVAALTKG